MYKERIFYLDLLRCIAILLVVFTHVHEVVGWSQFVPYELTRKDVIISAFCYSISRLGVPIFIMISGCLMIEQYQQNRKMPIKRIVDFFCFRNSICYFG
ncbi:acyltransferase family protein [Megamonas sp.]